MRTCCPGGQSAAPKGISESASGTIWMATSVSQDTPYTAQTYRPARGNATGWAVPGPSLLAAPLTRATKEGGADMPTRQDSAAVERGQLPMGGGAGGREQRFSAGPGVLQSEVVHAKTLR